LNIQLVRDSVSSVKSSSKLYLLTRSKYCTFLCRFSDHKIPSSRVIIFILTNLYNAILSDGIVPGLFRYFSKGNISILVTS